jgi:hypothetical protein
MRIVRSIIAVLIICLAADLHLAALQSVAWVRMVIEFQQDTSLADAVDRTLSGEEPCSLCLLVKQIDHVDQESDDPERPPPERSNLKFIPPAVLTGPPLMQMASVPLPDQVVVCTPDSGPPWRPPS